MAARSEQLFRQLRRLVARPASAPDADAVLLGRFIRRHDQDAFAALVRRHGPLVMGVCRRVLGDVHRAEDAAQAVFLIFARKAATIRPPDRLAAWLHGVARHVAWNARRAEDRRRHQETHRAREERTHSPASPLDELSARELLDILDEELQRLPEVYRLPLILCCLEGRTQDEAAGQLGWTPGSVKGRLERGRAHLHKRLLKRGLTLPVALLALEATRGITRAGFDLSLPRLDQRIPPSVAALVEEGIKSVGPTKARFVLVLLAASVAAAGVGSIAHEMFTAGQPGPQQTAQVNPETKRAEAPKEKQAHTDRYGDPLPPGAIQRLGTVRLRHGQWVGCVAFSPDGKTLVSGGWDNAIRIWDPASGKELRRFEGHSRGVFGLAFTADGKTLASAGNDGMICLWDVKTGQARWKRQAHEGSTVRCVAVSPDGKRLASGGGGNRTATLALWDVETGKELRRLGDNMRTVRAVAFSPDGKTLAAVSDVRRIWRQGVQLDPGVARLWDVETGKLQRELDGHRGGVTAVAFSSDGKWLATTSHDGTICFWDPASGKRLRTIQVSEDPLTDSILGRSGDKGFDRGGVLAAVFSHDSKLLASSQHDGTVRLWQTDTGKELRTLRGHGRETVSIVFSPDDRTLVSGSYDHTIRLWNPANGQLLHAPAGHEGGVARVAIFPDGKRAASAGHDCTLRIWDLAYGRELTVFRGHTQNIQSLAVSPDGKTLASGSDDKTIRLWDVESGRQRGQVLGVTRGAYALGFSPDGKLLAWTDTSTASPANDKGSRLPIRLSDSTTGREIRRMEGAGEYYGVRFSPDGKWLAGYAFGRGVDLWDVATGKRRHVFGDLIDFAFVPNANSMIGWCKDGMVRCHDLADGREIRAFQGPSRPNWVQRPFSLSPDGRTILFVQEDKAQLWETATGRMRRTISGHGSQITDCALAPDGRTAISASWDTTLLVWDVARRTEERPTTLTEKELEELWRNLAGADAAGADRAIWTLVAREAQTIPFLKQRLHPVLAAEPARMVRLLADLDSEQFALRAKAERELEELAELAEPALQKALANPPSLESRRRMEHLLNARRGPLTLPETIRAVRAVEVLEHIGTPSARHILERLAGGAAQARLTLEARASLARLARRPTAQP